VQATFEAVKFDSEYGKKEFRLLGGPWLFVGQFDFFTSGASGRSGPIGLAWIALIAG
jgi:hypothetical protein